MITYWCRTCTASRVFIKGTGGRLLGPTKTYRNSGSSTSCNSRGSSGSRSELLGGTTPGFGADNHDQINDSGTLFLFDPVTLSILPYNNFIPSAGDEFVVMTWQTELQGTFANVLVDPLFNSNNIAFDLIVDNAGSAGSLTLRATVVPEPSTLILALLGLALLSLRRRR